MSFSPDDYERIRAGCQRSAAAIVPYLLSAFEPRRVVDVGGGEGWWAREFLHHGAEYALVLDESLSERRLNVGDSILEFGHLTLSSHFLAQDIGVGGFDIALCLEVAEHLSVAAGDQLIPLLCRLAPIVVFSAAIPNQGGHGHLNEQWPSYWADRFSAQGWACHDESRLEFWEDDEIEPWYRQNLLLFSDPVLFEDHEMTWTRRPLPLVHPTIYGWRVAERDA